MIASSFSKDVLSSFMKTKIVILAFVLSADSFTLGLSLVNEFYSNMLFPMFSFFSSVLLCSLGLFLSRKHLVFPYQKSLFIGGVIFILMAFWMLLDG
ncbi:manganese efflux pump MntP [compost metagenome]